MNEFSTVYEYSPPSSNNQWAIGLIFVFISFVLSFGSYKIHETFFNVKTMFGLAMLAFSLFWTINVFKTQTKSKNFAFSIIRNKEYQSVTGEIANFIPMPSEGHQDESFTVKGVNFTYSDFEAMEGFNKTKSHGGPIQGNGDSVKIDYYTRNGANYIIKLQIKYNH